MGLETGALISRLECDGGVMPDGFIFVSAVASPGRLLRVFPMPCEHMLTWCRPLHFTQHFGDLHSLLMWPLRKHTKHLPGLSNTCFLAWMLATLLHELKGWSFPHTGACACGFVVAPSKQCSCRRHILGCPLWGTAMALSSLAWISSSSTYLRQGFQVPCSHCYPCSLLLSTAVLMES